MGRRGEFARKPATHLPPLPVTPSQLEGPGQRRPDHLSLLNKSPNVRMVDTYVTERPFDWASRAPPRNHRGGSPRLVRVRSHCLQYHAPWPPPSAGFRGAAAQDRGTTTYSSANVARSTPGHTTDRSTSCSDRARRRRSRSYLSRSGRSFGDPFGHRPPTSPPHPSWTPWHLLGPHETQSSPIENKAPSRSRPRQNPQQALACPRETPTLRILTARLHPPGLNSYPCRPHSLSWARSVENVR